MWSYRRDDYHGSGVGHINRFLKLRHIDGSPFSQYVDAYFIHTWSDRSHWLPVTWFETTLNCPELETCSTASFIGETAKIIKTRSHKLQRLDVH